MTTCAARLRSSSCKTHFDLHHNKFLGQIVTRTFIREYQSDADGTQWDGFPSDKRRSFNDRYRSPRPRNVPSNIEEPHPVYSVKFSKPELRDRKARYRNRQWLREPPESHSPETDLIEETNERNVDEDDLQQGRRAQKILALRDQKTVEQYYKDPLRLADAVVERLRVPDLEAALRLVRASEASNVRNVVSWNHCMDWSMGQGNVKMATKIYNEMKKRGHKPDSHTYTIMLRGFAQAAVKKKNVVKDAVAVYNSIFAPNSAVTPSTIHTNAILNVCARANDLDSLWSVVARMPANGAGSADRTSYTTILNALQDWAVKESQSSSNDDYMDGPVDGETQSRILRKALDDGKKLWEDVSYRWRRADMVIDEKLVCAMGRLLLLSGKEQDAHQIFDLVETTMRIKIPNRQVSERLHQLEKPGNEFVEQAVPEDGLDTNVPQQSMHMPLTQSSVYATPGNMTLSLILETCHANKSLTYLAPSYWHAMCTDDTGPKIQPDARNIMAYLRMLRVLRASSRAMDILSKDWPEDVTQVLYARGAFVMVMSACLRDKKNPNVFATAQRLITFMTEKLDEQAARKYELMNTMNNMSRGERRALLRQKVKEDRETGLGKIDARDYFNDTDSLERLKIDPKILGDFVKLALRTTEGWEEGIRGKDDGTVFERNPSKNHTLIALGVAEPILLHARRLLKLRLDATQSTGGEKPALSFDQETEVRDLLQLIRTTIGAFDKVVEISDRFEAANRRPINQDLITEYRAKQREYNAYMAKIEKTTGIVIRSSARDFDEEDNDDATRSSPQVRRRSQTNRRTRTAANATLPLIRQGSGGLTLQQSASRSRVSYSGRAATPGAAQSNRAVEYDQTGQDGDRKTWAQRYRDKTRPSWNPDNSLRDRSILENEEILSTWSAARR